MMDFTFEATAWEQCIDVLPRGSSLSAARFLTLMEPEGEEAMEDAVALLQEKDILLDVSDLPQLSASGETVLRLRQEKQLVQEGRLPAGLEENDPLRLYLEEIALLNKNTEPQALAEKCLHGDEKAQSDLTARMLGRVVEIACGYAGQGVLLMDLIQEGSMGLWQAVLGYNGGDFTAQCDRCVRQAVAVALTRQARASGVGQKMRTALEDYRAVDERLLGDLGRNPTLEEIAAELHMTLEEAETVAQTLDAARTVSRAKAATQEREETPDDQAAVEDTAYFQSRARIAELLSALDEKEAKLIALRYGLEGGLPLSPEDTGRRLGMTAEEVVAAEAAALARLRSR